MVLNLVIHSIKEIETDKNLLKRSSKMKFSL